MSKAINYEVLTESAERIARKDIRIGGYAWKAHRYFYNAVKAFQMDAVESFAIACEIIIDGQAYEGVVMTHRDGRIYPVMRETYDRIYGG